MRPIFIITLLALLLSALTGCTYERNYNGRGHDERRCDYYTYDRGGDYHGYHDYHHYRYRAFGRQESRKVKGLVRDAVVCPKREYIGRE